jgi:predicted dehydrogenase
MENSKMHRRTFIAKTGTVVAGGLLLDPLSTVFAQSAGGKKMRIAVVGTGTRAINMWVKPVAKDYAEQVEFVGICDINPGRVATAKKMTEVTCPTFTDFAEMMKKTKPDTLMVMTVDSTHDEFIIKGMEMGANIITEKPMTTDETKCQAIIDAEKRTGKKVTVTFNYRYSPHRAKIYELLRQDTIGKITSVDFHWYLDTHHGADYFRRWHRLKEKGGTLLVHKSTHHFDLLNWWLESDPEEVVAYGKLEFYGKNNSFRHTNCRPCPHKAECKFYWDINSDPQLVEVYANNEQHDGYLRDGCVWKEDINIYDKMAVQIKYANDVQVSYSLTTYSPYEGYRISFNGTKGKIDAWIKERLPEGEDKGDEILVSRNFEKPEVIHIPYKAGGHGGGDILLKDKIFKTASGPDPLRQAAGTRDGALSILVGIAARQSIETGKPVKIGDLTSIKPQKVKM